MIKEALKYLVEQAIQPDDRVVNMVDTNDQGRIFIINDEGNGVEVKPNVYRAKHAIRINTLNGFCNYVESKVEKSTQQLFVHIEDERTVRLLGTLDIDGGREELIVATALVPEFAFGRFHTSEELIINLQSKFVPSEDRDILLRVLGNIKEENVRSTGDDGVSQAVSIKQGVASVADVKVPNPVALAPYRTFLEVEQPESSFIFRMKEGPIGAIFEADGGAWRNEAILRIADYLHERLIVDEDLGNRITILA